MAIIDAVRAETVKAVSLRMPVYTAVGTATLVIGLSWVLTSLVERSFESGRSEEAAGLEPASAFLAILHYGQIGVILFGSWFMFEEQDRGSMRTALLAIPARTRLFAAKAIVATCGSLTISAIAVLGSYWVRQPVLGGLPSLTESGSDDMRVISGYIVYWTLLGILAFAVSAIARNGLIGLGVLLALVMAVSPYLLALTSLARFLPDQAGAQIYQNVPSMGGDLGPTTGAIVLVVWVLLALIGGSVSFRAWAIRD